MTSSASSTTAPRAVLIIIAPFTSRYEMGKYMFKFTPQKLLFLDNSFISEDKIKNIKIDTLIIHGKQDKLIPFYMWETIYQNSWAKNKYFIKIKNGWHNNILYKYKKEINPYIINFLNWKKMDNEIIVEN